MSSVISTLRLWEHGLIFIFSTDFSVIIMNTLNNYKLWPDSFINSWTEYIWGLSGRWEPAYEHRCLTRMNVSLNLSQLNYVTSAHELPIFLDHQNILVLVYFTINNKQENHSFCKWFNHLLKINRPTLVLTCTSCALPKRTVEVRAHFNCNELIITYTEKVKRDRWAY